MANDHARALLAKLRELERHTQAKDWDAVDRVKAEAIAMMGAHR